MSLGRFGKLLSLCLDICSQTQAVSKVVGAITVYDACAKSDLVRFDVTGQFMGALLVCLPGGARNFSPQAFWGAQQSFPQVGVC